MAGGGHHSFEDFLGQEAEHARTTRRAYLHDMVPFRVRVIARGRGAWLLRLEDPPAEVPEDKREAWVPGRFTRLEVSLKVDPDVVVTVGVRRWLAFHRGWTSDRGVE